MIRYGRHCERRVLLLQALTMSVSPLYISVCVSRLVSALADGKRTDFIILILFLLLLGNLLLRAMEAWLEWQCSYRYMRMQDAFTVKNSMKAMKMEYFCASVSGLSVVCLYHKGEPGVWRGVSESGSRKIGRAHV